MSFHYPCKVKIVFDEEQAPEEEEVGSVEEEEEEELPLMELKPSMRIRPVCLVFESPLFNRLMVLTNELRRYVARQRYLPRDLEDAFLVNVLLSEHADMEKAKKALKNYFYKRQEDSAMFQQRCPSVGRNAIALSAMFFLPLRKKAPKKPSVILAGLADSDPRLFNLVDCARMFFLTLDIIVHADMGNDGKVFVLFDGSNLVVNHFKTFNEAAMTAITAHIRSSQILKITKVHCVNMPRHILAIIHVFRNHTVHDTLESLHQCLPASYLPTELGGEAGTLQCLVDEWLAYLFSNKEWIRNEDRKRSDEYERRNARDKYRVEWMLHWQKLYDLETERLREDMLRRDQESPRQPEEDDWMPKK